ncbi:MAG: UDP-N-acetylmuramate dehydrogenase [Planctomycetota bacterium]
MYENLFKLYQEIVRFNEPLARSTSFKIGGPAEILLAPRSVEELTSVYQLCRRHEIPVFILGGGTNLLVSDTGVKGAVIKITFSPKVNPEDLRGNHRLINDEIISADAGHSLNHLVITSLKAGLGGPEILAGIPGTVGGAVMMNAGGKYGTIGDLVESLTVLASDGTLHVIKRDGINFGYRTFGLLAPQKAGAEDILIVKVTLRLKKERPEYLKERFQEILKEKIRTQPLNAKSAGCVFKNPENQSAGALIDQAGLKGLAVGGAKVSEQHANFIINTGQATARDVLTLMEQIKKTVADKFKVNLEPEIKIW